MSVREQLAKPLAVAGVGVLGVSCLLSLVVGTAALGAFGIVLGAVETAAILAAVAGVTGPAWLRFRQPARAAIAGGGGHGKADEPQSPIACDFDAIEPEARDSHADNAERLLTRVEEIRRIDGGYAFRLPRDESNLMSAARFMAHERKCCRFLDFRLAVRREDGPFWLEVAGGPGVDDYLRREMVALLQSRRPDLVVQS